ncbi:beta-lactamase/transpeptidase-like protein [Aspergillus unguis]
MDVIDRLQATLPQIAQILTTTQAPSVTFGVAHHGRIIYTNSIGHLTASKCSPQPDANTKYMIGSCSKMFTAAAVGILVAEGKLNWTDPISKYIPEFNPIHNPRIGKEADIIDCMRHSTGITAPSSLTFGPHGTIVSSEEDAIALLNIMPTADDKGQRFNREWAYNNSTVGLVGLLVQRVSGMRFADFVQEKLLTPLGMTRTAVKREQVYTDDNVAAPCTILSNGELSPAYEDAWPCEGHTPLLAATGIRSTLHDMLTWSIAVMDAERAEADPTYTPQVPNNPLQQVSRCRRGYWTRPADDPDFSEDAAYGMGWWRAKLPSSMLGAYGGNYFSRDKEHKTHLEYILGKEHATPFQMVGHTGGMRGSIFSVFTFPETQSAVVTMTNGRDYGDVSDFAAQLLIQALFELKPVVDLLPWAKKEAELARAHYEKQIQQPWTENRRPDDPKRELWLYIGDYRGFEGLFSLTIRLNGDQLAVVFNHRKASECPLVFYKKDTYSFCALDEDESKRKQILTAEYNNSLLEFHGQDKIEGLKWKWDKSEEPAWFERV